MTKNENHYGQKFDLKSQFDENSFLSSQTMFQCCTKVVAVVCATLRTPNPNKNMIFFSQVLVFAWYFAAFLVRTPYTAADTLTAGSF